MITHTMSERTRKALLGFVAVALFAILYLENPYKVLKIQGNSMCPTALNGEFVIVNSSFKINRFDVVTIFDSINDDLLLKRIIGMPNDTIEIKDGFIFVNGKKTKDSFGIGKLYNFIVDDKDELKLYEEGLNKGRPMTQNMNFPPIVLAEDEYFYIGDNRTFSFFGITKKESIVGKLSSFFHL